MQLPYSEELNIEYLGQLFRNTTECYKFFWFKAIVKKVTKGKLELTYEELVDEMIADAWYMVTEYHLNLGPKDTLESLVTLIKQKNPELKSKEEKTGQPEPDIGVQEKAEKDKLLDELMGKPVQKEENAQNPSVAKTEKSPQSEPISEKQSKSAEGATMTKDKPSVKEELRKIKESRKEQEADKGTSALDKSGASDRAKSANSKTEYKQPQRKKKHKKSKETR